MSPEFQLWGRFCWVAEQIRSQSQRDFECLATGFNPLRSPTRTCSIPAIDEEHCMSASFEESTRSNGWEHESFPFEYPRCAFTEKQRDATVQPNSIA
jgi:hypothetical protein